MEVLEWILRITQLVFYTAVIIFIARRWKN